VLADSNASFMAAMDSIGFTQSERRSDTALFSQLGSSVNLNEIIRPVLQNVSLGSVPVPDITVNDFNDWVDRFTTIEAPSILTTSGKFGLDFVTDQADTLFWVIGIVLYALKNNSNGGSPLLDKVLSYERVKQTLSELLFQLNSLADLGTNTTN
jgi:hypothetical protein